MQASHLSAAATPFAALDLAACVTSAAYSRLTPPLTSAEVATGLKVGVRMEEDSWAGGGFEVPIHGGDYRPAVNKP